MLRDPERRRRLVAIALRVGVVLLLLSSVAPFMLVLLLSAAPGVPGWLRWTVGVQPLLVLVAAIAVVWQWRRPLAWWLASAVGMAPWLAAAGMLL